MGDKPSYPADVPVGNPVGSDQPAAQKSIASKSRGAEAADRSEPPHDEPDGRPAHRGRIAAGAAIGIGSAALVAALLYARSHRRKDKEGTAASVTRRPVGKPERSD